MVSGHDTKNQQKVFPASAKPISRVATKRPVVQPKLVVGAAGDAYEQEADRVADEVVASLHGPVPVRRMTDTSSSKIQPSGVAATAIGGDGGSPIRRMPIDGATSTRPLLADTSNTIRRGMFDWVWGATTTTGEVLDTGSAGMEAVDETHKVITGLTDSALLTDGMMKSGTDYAGIAGGLIGGGKDVAEGIGSMRAEGVGVGSSMKAIGGSAGLLGGGNKLLAAYFGGESADEFLTATIGLGGEEIAGWLDFVSGGTKALSGAYLTGTSQIQYSKAKAIKAKSPVAEVRAAAGTLMEVINESWYAGMWDVGIGTLDMVASNSIPGYTAVLKTTAAVSKLGGGDLLWGLLGWASGGMVRTNDQVGEQVEQKIATLSGTCGGIATKALRANDEANLKLLFALAQTVAPEFATALGEAVKQLPRVEFKEKKAALKGIMWNT